MALLDLDTMPAPQSGVSLRGVSKAFGKTPVLDGVDLDIAASQNARQHFRQVVALRNGERPRLPAHIEPVTPELAGRRACDSKERLRRLDGQCGRGKRHEAL